MVEATRKKRREDARHKESQWTLLREERYISF